MKDVWVLPDDSIIQNTGTEWLLRLLNSIDINQRVATMMTIWRIWHNHNELTHGKACPSIEGSRRFLVSYLNSLLLIKQYPSADIAKGKMCIDQAAGFSVRRGQEGRCSKERQRWKPPKPGWVKLNVDGAFAKGVARTGMVLRDEKGAVVAAASRCPRNCRDATEAELMAMEEGLSMAMLWSPLPLIVETDCSEAVELIKEGTPNTSIYSFRVTVIRDLLRERESTVLKISRDANVVSHELAKIGRVQLRSDVWFDELPTEVEAARTHDCNFSTV
jgi:ribonuclease HI